MRWLRAALAAAFAATWPWAPLVAQDVTLSARDGSVEITGTLLRYDGEFYRVRTEFGTLTVDGSAVRCAGPGCPDLEAYVAELTFSGAASMARFLLPPLLEAFAERQGYRLSRREEEGAGVLFVLSDPEDGTPVARFLVRATDSDEGIAALVAREADVALSARPVSAEEDVLAAEAGLGRLSAPAQNRVVALDALVAVVSPRNPVREVSPGQLARIFAGALDSWRPLGGADAPIDPFLPAADAGVLRVFERRIMQPEGLRPAGRVRYFENPRELAHAVGRNPLALGLTLRSASGDGRVLLLSGGCGFRAAPSPEALKSGDYPLTVPLFFYTGSIRLPAVGREFLRFLATPAAGEAILRAGFVDQGFSRIPLSRQGHRLANAIRAAGGETALEELKRLVEELEGRRRLSVTFRFEDGSARLGARSRADIALLARALESGTLGGRDLLFAGFSDGTGSAGNNRQLSRQRAASVRDAVREAAATADPARVELRAEGFGEAMPLACDDTAWGRRTNRRVEVWIR